MIITFLERLILSSKTLAKRDMTRHVTGDVMRHVTSS